MSSLRWRHLVGMGAAIAMVLLGLLGLLGALNQGPIVLAILVGLATVFIISGMYSWKAIKKDQDLSS